ncbi:penicillin-binding transpeptidase domain-containing protein [Streptomyces sp. SBR177]
MLSREAADTTTSVLRGVVRDGTGTAALAAGRPAAGKTGTAEDDKAAWFAGYTPELATVVAMMGQDPETGRQLPLYGALGLPRINGGGAPAEIWARFTRDALAGVPVKEFDLRLMEGAEELPLEPPLPDYPDQGYEGPQRPRGKGAGAPKAGAEAGAGTGVRERGTDPVRRGARRAEPPTAAEPARPGPPPAPAPPAQAPYQAPGQAPVGEPVPSTVTPMEPAGPADGPVGGAPGPAGDPVGGPGGSHVSGPTSP